MENISFSTTQNVNILSNKAGVGDRFLAGMTDYFSLLAFFFITFLLVNSSNIANFTLINVIYGLIFFFYFFVSELFMDGQSIGKNTQNIKVISQSGQNANVGQLFIRNLIRPLDLVFGIIFIAFTPKAQRIGDLAAGTVVVKIKNYVTMDQMAHVEVEQDYSPVHPRIKINKLKPSDIELIKKVLVHSKRNANYSLTRKTYDKTRDITGIEPQSKPVIFLQEVLKDYNYYNS